MNENTISHLQKKHEEDQGRLTNLSEITELGTGEAHIPNYMSQHLVTICCLITQLAGYRQ